MQARSSRCKSWLGTGDLGYTASTGGLQTCIAIASESMLEQRMLPALGQLWRWHDTVSGILRWDSIDLAGCNLACQRGSSAYDTSAIEWDMQGGLGQFPFSMSASTKSSLCSHGHGAGMDLVTCEAGCYIIEGIEDEPGQPDLQAGDAIVDCERYALGLPAVFASVGPVLLRNKTYANCLPLLGACAHWQ
eukprot:2883934-Amphidinium_carterae.1